MEKFIWKCVKKVCFKTNFLVYKTLHSQSTDRIRIRWKFSRYGSGSHQKGPDPDPQPWPAPYLPNLLPFFASYPEFSTDSQTKILNITRDICIYVRSFLDPGSTWIRIFGHWDPHFWANPGSRLCWLKRQGLFCRILKISTGSVAYPGYVEMYGTGTNWCKLFKKKNGAFINFQVNFSISGNKKINFKIWVKWKKFRCLNCI